MVRSNVFAVNRSLDSDVDFELSCLKEFVASTIEAKTLHDSDLDAKNTLTDQNRVVLHDNDTAKLDSQGGRMPAYLSLQ